MEFMFSMNQVLALRGSYHGDTLGAMEAQAPSPYTGFLQQPWYGTFIKAFTCFLFCANCFFVVFSSGS